MEKDIIYYNVNAKADIKIAITWVARHQTH